MMQERSIWLKGCVLYIKAQICVNRSTPCGALVLPITSQSQSTELGPLYTCDGGDLCGSAGKFVTPAANYVCTAVKEGRLGGAFRPSKHRSNLERLSVITRKLFLHPNKNNNTRLMFDSVFAP